jgi:hypothetical protein
MIQLYTTIEAKNVKRQQPGSCQRLPVCRRPICIEIYWLSCGAVVHLLHSQFQSYALSWSTSRMAALLHAPRGRFIRRLLTAWLQAQVSKPPVSSTLIYSGARSCCAYIVC